MWHSSDGMGWWMVIGSVWMVFFWALVFYVIFAVVNKGSGGESAKETPLDILSRRYAAGEISKDEFDRMRQELS
jgi:putative membrane protein